MKISQNDILTVIRSSKRDGLSAREIMTALHLPVASKRFMHRLLRDMERQRLVKRIRGGRYTFARPAELFEGVISLSRRGDGSVEAKDGSRVRIPSRYLAGATDGDRVRYTTLRRDRMNRINGRVVDIVQRSGKLLIGSYQQGRNDDFILPVDASFSQPVSIDKAGVLRPSPGDWVVVRPQAKTGKGEALRGELVDILGNPDNPRVEMMASACRFSIPLHFNGSVINEAEKIDSHCSEDELRNRQDLRHLPFVTIDGETARDFDDAVTLQREENHFRLHVAIADVSHYVSEKGVIDQAAYERGTSVYFPGFCMPMLPEKLSNDVCSLKPDVDRLVMVAEILFDTDGLRRDASFYSAVIKSQARLTYTQVQEYLQQSDSQIAEKAETPLAQLPQMMELSRALTRQRTQRGSLELDIPEPEAVLDDSGCLETIRFSERLSAHKLIEEFMLAANEAVADFLADNKYDFPYRIHEPPEPTDFVPLNNYLAAHTGQKLVFNHDLHSDLQRLINAIEDESEKRVVSRLLLQSMKQARYSIENVGHYGLAAEKYCHFTSPIRRYPDLIVHRLLKHCLKKETKLFKKEKLAELAEHSSHRERLAVSAERDVQAMLACRFMQDKVGNVYSGSINSVQKFGLFIQLDDFPVEGLVHISKLEEDYYHFDSELNRLSGERTGQVFSVGNSLKISVENVNIARREIDFTLVADKNSKNPAPFKQRGRKRKAWR